MNPHFISRALLFALAVLCLSERSVVNARWGQGGGAGKRKEKEMKIFEEAFKLEMEAQGLEDPDAIDENLLMKRVRKMNRENAEKEIEARTQKRVSNSERDQNYMRSGRLVRDIAAMMAAGLFLIGLYAFRFELGLATPTKHKKY